MREFSTKLFQFKKGVFTVAASELNFPPGVSMREFMLTSENTGNKVKFVLTGSKKDAEGDVTHWEYESAKNEFSVKLKAIVFND